MRKKTFRNKNKNKKGGASFISNIIGDKTGYFIPENIENEVEQGNKEALLYKYKIKKEEAEKEYIRAKELKDDLDKTDEKWRERYYKFITNILGPFISKLIVYFATIFKFIFEFFIKFAQFFSYLFKQLKSIAFVLFTVFRDLIHSRGAIIVIIIFIIIIAVILSLFFNGKLTSTDNKIFKDASNKVIDFKKELTPESPYGILRSQLENLFPIPEEYTIQFTAFKNSINKFFGTDTINDNGDTTNREIITSGRYDGILHIKKDSDPNDNYIYSVYKPKDLTITANFDNHPNADINKLPKTIKDTYKYDNILINVNENDMKYSYNMDTINYYKNKSLIGGTITKPFITSNISQNNQNKNTIYNINYIPIDKYIFSSKDNISPNLLKEKLFNFNQGTSKYEYPINYIESEFKKRNNFIIN